MRRAPAPLAFRCHLPHSSMLRASARSFASQCRNVSFPLCRKTAAAFSEKVQALPIPNTRPRCLSTLRMGGVGGGGGGGASIGAQPYTTSCAPSGRRAVTLLPSFTASSSNVITRSMSNARSEAMNTNVARTVDEDDCVEVRCRSATSRRACSSTTLSDSAGRLSALSCWVAAATFLCMAASSCAAASATRFRIASASAS
mmetsp:Transcript_35317/g.92696  ORF Transcript_35317/g.92696 Transcript_35317/m.92696 type:complete len:200 (-) Transcript_35317:267-866(-)